MKIAKIKVGDYESEVPVADVLYDAIYHEGYVDGRNNGINDFVTTCDSISYEEYGYPLADSDIVKIAEREMKEQKNEKI